MIAGPSRLPITASVDPFDLLISEDLPIIPSSRKSSASDDERSDLDPDPDELSSVDGEGSDEEVESTDEAKQDAMRKKKREAVKSMREKLDGMMCRFFEHVEEYMGGKAASLPAAEMAAQNMADSGASTPSSEAPTPTLPSLTPRRSPPTPAQSLSHFQTLLNLFSRQILLTSATQHIPFVLFLCSSFSPAHTDLVLGLFVSQALYGTTTTSPTTLTQRISLSQRVAATVYIGSLVCRARFVTEEQARQVIIYQLAYIDGELLQTRTARSTEELRLFYAVCQAVMLIFCFRWRAFTSEKESDSVLGEMEMDGESLEEPSGDSKWMRDLEVLQRAITSELNPLLVRQVLLMRDEALMSCRAATQPLSRLSPKSPTRPISLTASRSSKRINSSPISKRDLHPHARSTLLPTGLLRARIRKLPIPPFHFHVRRDRPILTMDWIATFPSTLTTCSSRNAGSRGSTGLGMRLPLIAQQSQTRRKKRARKMRRRKVALMTIQSSSTGYRPVIHWQR